MNARSQPQVFGGALVISLILIAAITLVAVSLVDFSRTQLKKSDTALTLSHARLSERSAFEEAKHTLQSFTNSDHYLISSILHRAPQGSSSSIGSRYTFLSIPSAESLTHIPLFSGGETKSVAMPNLNQTETADLTNDPIGKPQVSFQSPPEEKLIEIAPLSHLDEASNITKEDRFPLLFLKELPSGKKEIYKQRYAWWIEDLEGYPNLDIVGTWTDHYDDGAGRVSPDFVRLGYRSSDPKTLPDIPLPEGVRLPLPNSIRWQFPKSFRGQELADQIAPGLSPREISLQAWATHHISIEDHPFFHAQEIASTRNLLPPMFKHRFARGLKPYTTIPHIPFGHDYEDEGKPRFPLNQLIANRDLTLAEIIDRNLPQFESRRGGLPWAENYVGTIAANAIDYADNDPLPSLPSNTLSAGSRTFRGVDSYCPVNELFIRFTYSNPVQSGSLWVFPIELDLYAEFWNCHQHPVEMTNAKLDFHFLDGLRFQIDSNDHRFSRKSLDAAISINEPMEQGFSLTLAPNEIQVVSLGQIRWELSVSVPSDNPHPVISRIRGLYGSSARANYELILNGSTVDSRGRTPPQFNSPRHGFFFQTFSENDADTPDNTSIAFMRAYSGNSRLKGFGALGSARGSHLGDPWMSYYSESTANNAGFSSTEYRNHASPGLRNHSPTALSSRPTDQRDLLADQTRVRHWPDRGYDNSLGKDPSDQYHDQLGDSPSSDSDLPTEFGVSTDPERAPWRLSNLGRFYSLTELGHLHDPAMWIATPPGTENAILNQHYNHTTNPHLQNLPADAQPSPLWGGGNTLRIGRPEHERFDQAGMRASQLLDLFHVGTNGSNLEPTNGDHDELYRHYDPRDHQPPPTAPNPVEAQNEPYSLVYDPQLHAQSRYRRIYGHLNLNSAPSLFEIETLLRGPLVSSSVVLEADSHITPRYTDEIAIGNLTKTLKPDTITPIAQGIVAARPFYSLSHFARVLSELIKRYDALPASYNDAEAEETFARIANTTHFSSRHFRIYTYGETIHTASSNVVARRRRVYEVFLEPIRNSDGEITRSRLHILSTRNL